MRILPTILLFAIIPSVLAEPLIVANAELRSLDTKMLQRIYMGRVVEVDGVRVTPINLPPGNATRERFLRAYLAQDEDDYTSYWTVRRYVGKGTPPRELRSVDDVLRFVSRTPGAIGYVERFEEVPGVKVILSMPR